MRIICISDTHNQNGRIAVPDGDVLVHAGDMTMNGRHGEVMAALGWLGGLPHKYKLVIAGNHDFLFEDGHDDAVALAYSAGVHYLQDSAVVLGGLKFYGSPWQPWFGGWAFNQARGLESRETWAKIPDDTDVLITHGPPHGALDECPDMNDRSHIVSVGCKDLASRVSQVQPRLHVFGHIHQGYGQLQSPGHRTLFVNASVCTGSYQPTNAPIVVDL